MTFYRAKQTYRAQLNVAPVTKLRSALNELSTRTTIDMFELAPAAALNDPLMELANTH
jgi:hypothetical protein